jgi:putative DNA primase/helicase
MALIPLHERARGRWKSILPALGIHPSFLTGKNGPCPLCPGGRDRWRFDDKRGEGTWICTRCGAGQGIKLAMRYTGLPFKNLAQEIERLLGDIPICVRAEQSDESNRARLNSLWAVSNCVTADDPVDRWFRGRGIVLSWFPKCLRYTPRVRHSGPPATYHPAMLAIVADSAGKPTTIHKTYLAKDGTKAGVDKMRMFCPGKRPVGGAVRLSEAGAVLGVAEGIETALAASQLFGVPTWSALDAGGIEKFEPPPSIGRLIVFGDNDGNGRGQHAAHTLAARLSGRIAVEVKIPDRSDTDWNDIIKG